MIDRTKPLKVAMDAEDSRIVASEPLLARFLIRDLESSEGIAELLALLDGPLHSVARRIAVRATTHGIHGR